MRAAFMPSPGQMAVGDFAVPEPSDGEALVQTEYAAICGSDAHVVYDGFHSPAALGKPGYPGHEGVGIVVESRSARVAAGMRVLTVPPGEAGGCFAEYQLVDDRHLIELVPGSDPRRLLMAQQLGTVVFAMKKFFREPAASAGVIGVGSAGLFFVQLLLAQGCEQVIASDVSPARLQIAERMGAKGVQVPQQSFSDEVLRATGGHGADLVIETAGRDICRTDAVRAVRTHGTVGCFGYAERRGLSEFPVHAAFRKAATVAWVRGTQPESGLRSFHEAIRLITAREIDVDDHIRYAIPLDEAPLGFETARAQQDVVKVLLTAPRSAVPAVGPDSRQNSGYCSTSSDARSR